MEPTTLVLAAAALVVPAVLDGSLPPAEKLLAEFESKAKGPLGAKSLRVKGTVTVPGMPAGGSFTETFQGEDRVKVAVEFPGMGSMTQGRIGGRAYSTDLALGIAVKESHEASGALAQYGLFRGESWRAHYASPVTKGKTDVEGKPCFEIALESSCGGKGATWFLDAETKLLARADIAIPDPMGGDIPVQWLLADWKTVQGGGEGLFAHKKTMAVAGMRIEFATTSVEVDVPLDDSATAPSKEVQAALDDASKRTPQAPAKGGECAVETVAEQPTASIRMTIPAKDVSKNLAVMLPEVMEYVTKSGAELAGPPFSRYHAIAGDTIDIEAGMPVRKSVPGEGRVKGSSLPGGKTAVTWHIGPYPELPKTYAVLEAWMKSQSLAPRGPFWEIYWTDPGIERDPAKWRTQILWPVN